MKFYQSHEVYNNFWSLYVWNSQKILYTKTWQEQTNITVFLLAYSSFRVAEYLSCTITLLWADWPTEFRWSISPMYAATGDTNF